jgi:hypothetical protein
MERQFNGLSGSNPLSLANKLKNSLLLEGSKIRMDINNSSTREGRHRISNDKQGFKSHTNERKKEFFLQSDSGINRHQRLDVGIFVVNQNSTPSLEDKSQLMLLVQNLHYLNLTNFQQSNAIPILWNQWIKPSFRCKSIKKFSLDFLVCITCN